MKILTMNTTASHLLAISQTDEGITVFARNFIQKYKARTTAQSKLSSQPDHRLQSRRSRTADSHAKQHSQQQQPGPPLGICE